MAIGIGLGLVLNPGGGSEIIDSLAGIDPRVTSTRASGGTYFDSAGAIQLAGTNVPRLDYNPVTLAPRGLLIEGSRTNLVLDSNNLLATSFGGTYWTALSSVTNSQLSGTSLGLNRFELASAGSAAARIQTNPAASMSITSGTTYSYTLYYEAGTSNRLAVEFRDFTATTVSTISGNIGSLTVAASGAGAVTILSDGVVMGSIRKLTATWVPNSTTSDARVSVGPFTSTAGQTVIAIAMQLEAGAFPSSYIPTTTASATRAADVPLISDLSRMRFNAAEGTIVAEFEVLQTYSVQSVLSLDDGTDANSIAMRVNFGGGGFFSPLSVISSSPVGSVTLSLPTVGINKAAFSYKADYYAGSINGGTPVTAVGTGIPTVNEMYIGRRADGNHLFGWIRKLTYYPEQKPDAFLQAVTQ